MIKPKPRYAVQGASGWFWTGPTDQRHPDARYPFSDNADHAFGFRSKAAAQGVAFDLACMSAGRQFSVVRLGDPDAEPVYTTFTDLE